MYDLLGKPCPKCHKGVMIETSLMDDINGVLHCSQCRALFKRYPDKK